jgi:hypothetical protein
VNNQQRIQDSIIKIQQFLNIAAEPQFQPWSIRLALSHRRARGVYVIYDNNHIYYVGKGNIQDRQQMHLEKFTGEFRRARDTRGFRQLRERLGPVDTQGLQCCTCELTQESAISALEGSLIHLLQPRANDEISG